MGGGGSIPAGHASSAVVETAALNSHKVTPRYREKKMATREQSEVLPYGVNDLDPVVYQPPGDRERVRCYVRGCKELLLRPRRGYVGEACPVHGIRCHYSGGAATYSYVDPRRNLIVDADLAARAAFSHPFKYDRNRYGTEKSEDALTWNVFRSLQHARLLHRVVKLVVPDATDDEPQLFLWGLHCGQSTFEPWDLLIAARERFESHLPVDRPKTEPDIALWLPGQFLILIEAKFTSSNPYYFDGPRKDAQSLTKNELVEIYQDSELKVLNYSRAQLAKKIPYQLWRNMIFAEWMAIRAGTGEVAYHANLTCRGAEAESQSDFRCLLDRDHGRRFVVLDWEHIIERVSDADGLCDLLAYIQSKSRSLQKAL